MAIRAKASVGRQSVAPSMRFVSPASNSYISLMRLQMEHISARLTATINKVKGATPEAIMDGLQPIMDRSQELVPVDHGTLKRSAYMEVRQSSQGPVVAIGYAKGGFPHYAAFVHEMVHIPHAKGKSAKFLEIAINERLHILKRRIELHLQKAMGLESQW